MGGESAGESARIWVEYEVIRQGRGRGEGWIKSRSPCVGGWQMEGVKESWRESKKKIKSKPITQTSVVLIGKSSFTSLSVSVATSSGLLFPPSFILMGAPALKYHNVVAGKSEPPRGEPRHV